ncbi:MAG: ATP-binding cassette domain-containing protein, partial [Bacteroidetes bacterium]|nr:ATP-binding cassette domain-containing protein [Bacteroidota bacterium]
MSEEILKALMQLFAIITKQGAGSTERERQYVQGFLTQQISQASVVDYLELYDGFSNSGKKTVKKRTSVLDSARTMGICHKINKTLTQKQKVVVLIRLLELVKSDGKHSRLRMQIIDTVSDVFKITSDEHKTIESFVLKKRLVSIKGNNILLVNNKSNGQASSDDMGHIQSKYLNGVMGILNVKSVNMYFVKYLGIDDIHLNGFAIKAEQVYLFAYGSIIKLQKGDPIFYSDVISYFLSEDKISPLSFNAKNISYSFPSGETGLVNVNLSEGTGKLVGIMGASGAGKSTLLNILTGMEKPSNGTITINDLNIHTQKKQLEGVIGYVAQDDLLFEELTVFQNLYYNAKLCFDDLPDNEINKKVLNTLDNLGLLEIKHLKVGTVLNKKISGGQRKRLNIALELIREPAVMFLDEPTSGLSSRDSENVMDLLKELSLKGKLVFVVIHQPSSEIYKMFDRMLILDTGGYPIYYGNPIEAVMYFKRKT